MQVVVVDARNLRRGFAGDAFPFIQVDDLLIFVPVSGVVLWKPGMREAIRVVIGVDARIVGGELLHFVEAMLDRIELGLIPEMPLTREVSRITAFLEELGDCRSTLRQTVRVAWDNHDGKS